MSLVERGTWIRRPTDFKRRPSTLMLEQVDERFPDLWMDLVCLFCEADAALGGAKPGHLLFRLGQRLAPWTAKQLARALNVTDDLIQLLIDTAIDLEMLIRDSDGVLYLPDWRGWWGKLPPKTSSERTEDWREREARKAGLASTTPREEDLPPRPCNDDVTKRHKPVTTTQNDVTISDYITDTDTDTEHGYIHSQRYSTEQKQSVAACPVSFEMDKSIGFPEFGEDQFAVAVISLFEKYVRTKSGKKKTWSQADHVKLKDYLQQPWALKHGDWSVRITAIRFGLHHMVEDVRAHAQGRRSKPVNSPWPYALSLAAKYADFAAEQVAIARSAAASGKPANPAKYVRNDDWSDPYVSDWDEPEPVLISN